MASDTEHKDLLEQLQKEINLVLEHVGRVFQAGSTTATGPPLAQASRLKHELPGALGRFHSALDQLEDELQLAKLVMRRDLAVLREKSGVPSKALSQHASSVAHSRPSIDFGAPTIKMDDQAAADIPDENLDVSMTEAPPANEVDVSSANLDATNGTDNAGVKVETPPHNAGAQPDTVDEKPTAPLKLETDAKDDQVPQDIDDKAPDTAGTNAFSANADLDSLFNDGGSVGGGPGSANAFGGNDNDFDFENFNATLDENADDDKNDLSSLLPGLSEYANNGGATSGEPDFSALFSTNNNDTSGNADGEKNQDENADDNTFDFMDFANFDAGAGGSGDVDLEFNFD